MSKGKKIFFLVILDAMWYKWRLCMHSKTSINIMLPLFYQQKRTQIYQLIKNRKFQMWLRDHIWEWFHDIRQYFQLKKYFILTKKLSLNSSDSIIMRFENVRSQKGLKTEEKITKQINVDVFYHFQNQFVHFFLMCYIFTTLCRVSYIILLFSSQIMNFFRNLLGCSDLSPQLPKEKVKNRSKPIILQEIRHPTISEDNKVNDSILKNTHKEDCRKDTSCTSLEIQITEEIVLNCVGKKQVGSLQQLNIGFLVGIINNHKLDESFLEKQSFKIHLGQSQEVSFSALRKNSLDSLVIFLKQLPSSSKMEQILKCSQQLVFVIQNQTILNQFLSAYEETLLEIYGDKIIDCCLDKISFELLYSKERIIVAFQPYKKSLSEFNNTLHDKLKQLKNIEMISELMTLEQYKNLKLLPVKSLTNKINQLQNKIQEAIKEQMKQQQLNQIKDIILNQSEEDIVLEPKRKNSSFEAQIQAEYFCQRESQKETRDSNKSKYIQNSDLFYFIEEHDSDEQQSNSELTDSPVSPSAIEKSTITRPYRSKSWSLLPEVRVQELDQQFFTKY